MRVAVRNGEADLSRMNPDETRTSYDKRVSLEFKGMTIGVKNVMKCYD